MPFISISNPWIKENVKTLGVHHGYNVDNDKIWKDIINRMKNCIQVWKSRKLSYKGKTIIVKNLLLSYCARYLFWFPPFVHIVKILSMLGLMYSKRLLKVLNK
jgi:hypothetical protein